MPFSQITKTWDTFENKLLFIVILFFGVIVGLLFLPIAKKITGFFYFSVILFAVGFAMLAQPSASRPIRVFPLICSFLCLYFTLAFRDISGVDDPVYQYIFETVNLYGWFSIFLSSFMEPGYLILNEVIGGFTDNYYVFQAIASFIPLFLIYKGFVKYSEVIYIPLALLLFCSTLYFQMLSVSLIRMFIAIGIIYCYALDALFQGACKRFIIFVICAATIHYSSLIMLLFIPLTFSRNFLLKHWKLIACALIVVSPVLFVFAGRVAGNIGGRYAQYEAGEGGFSILSLDTLPFLFMALYQWKKIPRNIWNIYAVSIILLLFSSICSIMSSITPLGRVIFYMNLSLYFLFPAMFRFRRNGVIIAGIVITYSLLYLFVSQFYVELRAEHLFPYKNLFFVL